MSSILTWLISSIILWQFIKAYTSKLACFTSWFQCLDELVTLVQGAWHLGGEHNVEHHIEIATLHYIILVSHYFVIVALQTLAFNHLYASWRWDLINWNQQSTSI